MRAVHFCVSYKYKLITHLYSQSTKHLYFSSVTMNAEINWAENPMYRTQSHTELKTKIATLRRDVRYTQDAASTARYKLEAAIEEEAAALRNIRSKRNILNNVSLSLAPEVYRRRRNNAHNDLIQAKRTHRNAEGTTATLESYVANTKRQELNAIQNLQRSIAARSSSASSSASRKRAPLLITVDTAVAKKSEAERAQREKAAAELAAAERTRRELAAAELAAAERARRELAAAELAAQRALVEKAAAELAAANLAARRAAAELAAELAAKRMPTDIALKNIVVNKKLTNKLHAACRTIPGIRDVNMYIVDPSSEQAPKFSAKPECIICHTKHQDDDIVVIVDNNFTVASKGYYHTKCLTGWWREKNRLENPVTRDVMIPYSSDSKMYLGLLVIKDAVVPSYRERAGRCVGNFCGNNAVADYASRSNSSGGNKRKTTAKGRVVRR